MKESEELKQIFIDKVKKDHWKKKQRRNLNLCKDGKPKEAKGQMSLLESNGQ